LCYFHNFIIKFTRSTNRKHLRISKSIIKKFRFDCRIKIQLLYNFAPFCYSRSWRRQNSPCPCHATDTKQTPRYVHAKICCVRLRHVKCDDSFSYCFEYNSKIKNRWLTDIKDIIYIYIYIYTCTRTMLCVTSSYIWSIMVNSQFSTPSKNIVKHRSGQVRRNRPPLVFIRLYTLYIVYVEYTYIKIGAH
jgi:hypothetical protein